MSYLDFPTVLLLVARNVATPRISETAMAVLIGTFPFTQRAPNSENAATDSPASTANILALLLAPCGKYTGAGTAPYLARLWGMSVTY